MNKNNKKTKYLLLGLGGVGLTTAVAVPVALKIKNSTKKVEAKAAIAEVGVKPIEERDPSDIESTRMVDSTSAAPAEVYVEKPLIEMSESALRTLFFTYIQPPFSTTEPLSMLPRELKPWVEMHRWFTIGQDNDEISCKLVDWQYKESQTDMNENYVIAYFEVAKNGVSTDANIRFTNFKPSAEVGREKRDEYVRLATERQDLMLWYQLQNYWISLKNEYNEYNALVKTWIENIKNAEVKDVVNAFYDKTITDRLDYLLEHYNSEVARINALHE